MCAHACVNIEGIMSEALAPELDETTDVPPPVVYDWLVPTYQRVRDITRGCRPKYRNVRSRNPRNRQPTNNHESTPLTSYWQSMEYVHQSAMGLCPTSHGPT